jgi:hypothetical protein
MKHIRKDETGNRYTRLIVLEFSHTDEKYHLAHWKCKCDCGNTVIVSGNSLRKGNTNSCGCYKRDKIHESRYKNELGKRFGYLMVLQDLGRTYAGKVVWRCECDCGNITQVPAGDLRSGKVISCGCNTTWKGENNPRWKGGIYRDKYKYPALWTKKLKKFIRSLDNHICQFPKCDYDDRKKKTKLHVHHIDGNKHNCDTKNLISLCHSHHSFIEANNPSKWIKYFYTLTGGIFE